MIIGGLPWSLWGMRSGEESQLCCFLRMLFRWEEFPSSLPLPPLQLPPSSPPPSLPVPTLYSWSREVWKENTAVRISCCSHHQHHRVQSRCVRGVDQDWQWWHQHWGRGGQMSANNSGKTASVLTTYSLTEKVSTNITFSQKKGSTSSSTDATSHNYWQSTLVNTKGLRENTSENSDSATSDEAFCGNSSAFMKQLLLFLIFGILLQI